MLQYAVVSSDTEQAVELYPTSEAAEAMIAEVRDDEPELAALLRVEAVELETNAN